MGRKKIIKPRYNVPVYIRRLAEYYGCSPDTMRRLLCRAEFNKFYYPKSSPRQYVYAKELELLLDKWLNPKGFYRCTGSKVHSRYSLERESSYSI